MYLWINTQRTSARRIPHCASRNPGSGVTCRLLASCLVVALAALASGCAGRHSVSSVSTSPPSGKTPNPTIGFSQSNLADPWEAALDAGLVAQAIHHTDRFEMLLKNGENKPAQQVRDIEDLISRKVNLMIVVPLSAQAVTAALQKAQSAHIPIVLVNRSVAGFTPTCTVAPDDEQIGRQAALCAARILQARGSIVEVDDGSSGSLARRKAFAGALRQAADLKLVDTVSTAGTQAAARTAVAGILRSGKPVGMVWAQSDDMALGAADAARAAGRTNIRVVSLGGYPGLNGGAAAVKSGKLAAAILYPPCAKEAMDSALSILKGEKVPARVLASSLVITRENADAYLTAR
jgi:ribose transport system substrate-binding protein